jgi:DNA modification methylase
MNAALAAARPQTAYVFTDWRMWGGLYDILESNGVAIRSMIVWDKGSPGVGSLWRTQHELIMFGSKGTNPRLKGVPSIGNVIQTNRTGNQLHCTQKPVDLIITILKNDAASGRTGPIYDPFLGSGTTLIAAEQLGRRCYAIEIEPRYVDVAVERWENLTGRKAKRSRA